MVDPCVFCEIAKGLAPHTLVAGWPKALAIVPLNPVVPGHVLILPRRHVQDAGEDPKVTGMVMEHAAEYAAGRPINEDFNLITSAGPAATQTVLHLHVHYVPRFRDDMLLLPWSPVLPGGGDRAEADRDH